jgi:hypothetical protein
MLIVQQWVKNPELLKLKGIDGPKTISVWSFLTENERGAIFRLYGRKLNSADEKCQVYEEVFDDDQPTYITLN